ncbi:hypothetical protein [Dactylosporangium matsuzakiense]|uniref:Secreted protein n=1 Tax=Dactylosporangium matsuzakiense TaxID=53360 RepID=A0A9W6NPS5_9ACTN|nr:hypothetical protein [Dactylosporangium matsuzakiense]GLL04618.1 hypothetical protein GCM10017581_063650 [Dactylosporangium matsuzakiense]
MRLGRIIAAALLAAGATLTPAAGPADAATVTCTLSTPYSSELMPNSYVTSPDIYTGTFIYGSQPSCTGGTPYLRGSTTTIHSSLNGATQPPGSITWSCKSGQFCYPPISSALWPGLHCDTPYPYDNWVEVTGYYQQTPTSARINLGTVVGPHRSGTALHPHSCDLQ